MAFESLTDKLQNVFKKLKGKGRLTEADVKVALKEVKMALLEADVNFKVVKQFTKSVQEKAIGQDGQSDGKRDNRASDQTGNGSYRSYDGRPPGCR